MVSAEQCVNAKLVRAMIQVESAYHPRARSPKGAMGLMQLMPATARQYGVADPYDPASNIEAGIKQIQTLPLRVSQAVGAGPAPYNASEGAGKALNAISPQPQNRHY